MSEKASASATASGGGIGIFGLMTVLFVGLKLTGHIDWPWVWVTAPAWGCFAAWMLIVGGVLTVAGIAIWRGR